jgi:putative tricarboxylic transport membrane protein
MGRDVLKGKLSVTTVTAAGSLLATLFLIWHTFDPVYQTSFMTAGRGPVFYPRIILWAMLLFSVIVLWEDHGKAEKLEVRGTYGWTISALVATGLYTLAITRIGFVFSTVIFMVLLPWFMGYRRILVILVLAVVYTLTVWYVFEEIFLIILPSSPWFEVF